MRDVHRHAVINSSNGARGRLNSRIAAQRLSLRLHGSRGRTGGRVRLATCQLIAPRRRASSRSSGRRSATPPPYVSGSPSTRVVKGAARSPTPRRGHGASAEGGPETHSRSWCRGYAIVAVLSGSGGLVLQQLPREPRCVETPGRPALCVEAGARMRSRSSGPPSQSLEARIAAGPRGAHSACPPDRRACGARPPTTLCRGGLPAARSSPARRAVPPRQYTGRGVNRS